MDTSTHITIGFGLAGLAYLDPAIASDPMLAQAILLGTVIGSNAPDFDYAIRLVKGNGMYTEHHRGASHSLPAIIIWTFAISALIFIFYNQISYISLLFWTFLAVCLHVGLDILNVYGTQAGRPFTKKWLSLNFIPLFDPIIMLGHLIGFTFWLAGLSPGITFLYVYIVLISYIIIRYIISVNKRNLLHAVQKTGSFTIIPTISLHKWDFVYETKSAYDAGSITGKDIHWIHHFEKHGQEDKIIKASLADKNVQHFLANSKHAHTMYFTTSSSVEVRWIDLRFRHKEHYPYMAIVKLDPALNILASYTGWVHHSRKLNEKLITETKKVMPL
ncbi:metal-dependent hydrolase [uncultured Metabacillus sp.]|uniref:metal-dependent hydrolase n=1 Tax=uncultured Metabacillus sp. TaxID=2860135 RepID=UPI00263088E3|nr:metal-dependent hydrolase [uncultured Metabacillus sp.]